MSQKKANDGGATFKVRLYANNSPTAAESPYLGRIVPNGVLSEDDFVEAMRTSHPDMNGQTIRYLIDALLELVRDRLREGFKIETPFGTVEPCVTGGFASEDAPPDPAKNAIVVRVTPPAALRRTLAKEVCEIVGAPQSDLTLSGVETPSLGRAGVDAVTPGADLTMTGRGFSDGTLAAKVVDAAGAEHALALTHVRSLYAQGTAPAGLAAGEARVVLTLTDAAEHVFTASRKVAVVTRS